MTNIGDHAGLQQWLRKVETSHKIGMLALRPTEVAELICEHNTMVEIARRQGARLAALRELVESSVAILSTGGAGDSMLVASLADWCRERDKLLLQLRDDELNEFRSERATFVRRLRELQQELDRKDDRIEELKRVIGRNLEVQSELEGLEEQSELEGLESENRLLG